MAFKLVDKLLPKSFTCRHPLESMDEYVCVYVWGYFDRCFFSQGYLRWTSDVVLVLFSYLSCFVSWYLASAAHITDLYSSILIPNELDRFGSPMNLTRYPHEIRSLIRIRLLYTTVTPWEDKRPKKFFVNKTTLIFPSLLFYL